MIQDNSEVFDREWEKYDRWYDQNPAIFQSELKAISKVIPSGIKFRIVATVQTLFKPPPEVAISEEPQTGADKGGFVVFKAIKDYLKKQRDE